MKTTKKEQSILWAIDPFETKNARRAPLAKAIRVLSRGLSKTIIPFSVVSPVALSWLAPIKLPDGKELRDFGTKSITKDLEKLHMRKIQSPMVKFQDSMSKKELVNDVLRYAKSKNAAIIAVNTKRLLSPFPFNMGGFAEALIKRSDVPVLAVSPNAKVSSNIRQIIFPTDFTKASHKAFRKTLAMATKLRAKIILLNAELFVSSVYPNYEENFRLEIGKSLQIMNDKNSKRWLKEAKMAGVTCSYQIISNADSVASAILQCSKKNRADLISIGNYRGSKSMAILGGTIRNVLSTSKIPVIEIRSA